MHTKHVENWQFFFAKEVHCLCTHFGMGGTYVRLLEIIQVYCAKIMEIGWHLTYFIIAKTKHVQFLSRVSTLTRDIDITILSVCLSVCPSMTFRY